MSNFDGNPPMSKITALLFIEVVVLLKKFNFTASKS